MNSRFWTATRLVSWVFQDGMMELTGNLLPECDGTPIQGADYVIVAPLSN